MTRHNTGKVNWVLQGHLDMKRRKQSEALTRWGGQKENPPVVHGQDAGEEQCCSAAACLCTSSVTMSQAVTGDTKPLLSKTITKRLHTKQPSIGGSVGNLGVKQ